MYDYCMTETENDLQYEASREHHSELKYSALAFPIDQNIFAILQNRKRLIVVKNPQDWDEGIFFDKDNIPTLKRYKQHLMVSVAQLIKDKNWNVDIDLLQELIPVPEDILLNDARKVISHVGTSPEEMISINDRSSIDILRLIFPQTTLDHETDHVSTSQESGDKSSYFLHSLLLADTGRNITMMQGTCFAHNRKLKPEDQIRVNLAPKFPSSGDFRYTKSLLINYGKGIPESISALVRQKSRTLFYAILNGESKPAPVYMPELRDDQNRRIYDWDDLKFIDPRRISYFFGKDYVMDEFVKLTGVKTKNVSELRIVHVNG